MAEQQAEKGTAGNPLTRQDVIRLIEENGGRTEGMDLSKKVFEDGIDLRGVNNGQLVGVTLKEAVLEKCHLEGLQLSNARFEGAFMSGAHLEDIRASGIHLENTELVGAYLEGSRLVAAHLEGAEFFDAHLEEATLVNAFLDRTRLSGAHLQGAHMQGAKFTADTEMASVNWGNYILGEEKAWQRKEGMYWNSLTWAEGIYRSLKQWYANAGMYDVAGQFFFREMTVRRKAMKWWPNPIHRAWSKLLSLICGYGEKPLRVVRWAAFVVVGLALVYFLVGGVWEWCAFWRSLYFSAVSFTALGYGEWVNFTDDWMRGLGAFESFVGVFSMALFLVTFTRKMTR